MPGSYSSALTPAVDTHIGPNPFFYSPSPHTPAATRAIGRQVVGYSGIYGNRKRPRHDVADPYFTTPYSATSENWPSSFVASSIDRFSDVKSPPPLANDQYELAGGSDTSQTLARGSRDEDDYYNLDNQRRGGWTNPTSPALGDLEQSTSSGVQTDGLLSRGTHQSTFFQLLHAVEGVAGQIGKIVRFCRSFKGFHAGGGQAYDVTSQGKIMESDIREDCEADPMSIFRPKPPGAYPERSPEDDYGINSIASTEETVTHASKKQRLDDRWIVVNGPGYMDSRASSPRLSERRVPVIQQSQSPSNIPRPVSSRSGSVAREFGVRRPLKPSSRRGFQMRQAKVSHAGSPTLCSNKSASFASPRAREYSRQSYGSPVLHPSHHSSPLPRETQRLVNKLRRDEMEEEARVKKMSAQTRAMLREAREALGSKVEIEDVDEYMSCETDMEDEGFSEDLPKWQPVTLGKRGMR